MANWAFNTYNTGSTVLEHLSDRITLAGNHGDSLNSNSSHETCHKVMQFLISCNPVAKRVLETHNNTDTYYVPMSP